MRGDSNENLSRGAYKAALADAILKSLDPAPLSITKNHTFIELIEMEVKMARKRILTLLLTLCMLSALFVPAYAESFSDIDLSIGSSYVDAINYM